MSTKQLLNKLRNDGFTVNTAELSLLGDDFDGFWAVSDHRYTDIGHISRMKTGEYVLSRRALPEATENGDLTQTAGKVEPGGVFAKDAHRVLELWNERYMKVSKIYAGAVRIRAFKEAELVPTKASGPRAAASRAAGPRRRSRKQRGG